MDDSDVTWLETVELPMLSWTQARAYQDAQWNQTGERSDLFDTIDAILHRYDALDRLDWACGDTKLPIEQRERIARGFFHVAAWTALATNELNEGQKAWAVTLLKKKSQQVERILAVWMASSDPHALLVRALRDSWAGVTAIEIGRIVEQICDGWGFAIPDRLSKAETKTLQKRFAQLAATPEVVEAVVHWLPAVPDFERRVLHAGAVLASEGSERSAAALRPILAEADTNRAWVTRIWSACAPKGSAVASMLR